MAGLENCSNGDVCFQILERTLRQGKIFRLLPACLEEWSPSLGRSTQINPWLRCGTLSPPAKFNAGASKNSVLPPDQGQVRKTLCIVFYGCSSNGSFQL